MSLTFTAKKFMYDKISSDKLNVMICNINEIGGIETAKELADVNIEQSKTSSGDIWFKSKSEYSSPLSFTFSICKKDCTVFKTNERRAIASWLQNSQGTYKKMQFFSNEFSNIVYYAKCTSLEKKTLNGEVIGYSLTFMTNAPYGFTLPQPYTINMTTSILDYVLVNSSDEIGTLIFPELEITILENCDFSIKNNVTDRIFKITGCKKNEVISVNALKGYLYSSTRGTSIINNFNNVWFSLTRDLLDVNNRITITGMASIKVTCKFPRKIGV